MTHISSKPIKRKVLLQISEQFAKYVASVSEKQDAEKLFGELLSKAERVMLVKRLAIIFMLERGYSYEAIQKLLHVSPSTIGRVWRNKKQGNFDFIVRQHRRSLKRGTRKSGEEDFWEVLETILQAGTPPMGKGRWRYLYRTTRSAK